MKNTWSITIACPRGHGERLVVMKADVVLPATFELMIPAQCERCKKEDEERAARLRLVR